MKRTYRFQNIGEQLVTNTLLTFFPTDSYHLLNNVTLKLEQGTTQIDHVLVSRYGIFVIETKHYKGWLFADAHSNEWTQVVYQWKSRFMNPIHQNYKHIKAIQGILDFIPAENITGLVVFTGDAEFRTPTPPGVFSLETLVEYLKNLNNEVMTENRRQFCVGRLETYRLTLTRQTDIEHHENLQVKRGYY